MRGYLKIIDKTYVDQYPFLLTIVKETAYDPKCKVSGVRLPGLRLVCTTVWVWSSKNFLHIFFRKVGIAYLRKWESVYLSIYLPTDLPTYLHLSSIQLHEEILNIKWFNVNKTLGMRFWLKQMLYVFLQTNQN